MTYHVPCSDEEKRDDWFIAKDGKQYPDDEFLTDSQKAVIRQTVVENQEVPLPHFELEDEVLATIADAEEEAKRQALIRRRKAHDACYECYFRLDCLDVALNDDTIRSGTWGGYYEEQLKVLRAERNKIRRRNRGQEEQQGS